MIIRLNLVAIHPRFGRRECYRALTALVILLGWAATGCRPAPTSQPSATNSGDPSKLAVFVSILPQAFFVERIGGEYVDVNVLVRPGQSPHSYEPTARQMSALAKARVFFRIGVPFEEVLVPKIEGTFKQLEMCDTCIGIERRTMACVEHDHDHDHERGTDDPHTWLSPRLVKIQAQNICDALCRLDPPHADDYRHNLAAFHDELDALDARLAAALAPLKGRELFVFHPAYGYFADAYGLKQVPVEIEGKEPTARNLAALIERAKATNVRVIFVQPQFSDASAAVVAREINGAVIPLDPLARDYCANMEHMAAAVTKALADN
ncbi:MAG: zinc ABC transporter substrate-binding protein [Planctomycetota bacterium]